MPGTHINFWLCLLHGSPAVLVRGSRRANATRHVASPTDASLGAWHRYVTRLLQCHYCPEFTLILQGHKIFNPRPASPAVVFYTWLVHITVDQSLHIALGWYSSQVSLNQLNVPLVYSGRSEAVLPGEFRKSSIWLIILSRNQVLPAFPANGWWAHRPRWAPDRGPSWAGSPAWLWSHYDKRNLLSACPVSGQSQAPGSSEAAASYFNYVILPAFVSCGLSVKKECARTDLYLP